MLKILTFSQSRYHTIPHHNSQFWFLYFLPFADCTGHMILQRLYFLLLFFFLVLYSVFYTLFFFWNYMFIALFYCGNCRIFKFQKKILFELVQTPFLKCQLQKNPIRDVSDNLTYSEKEIENVPSSWQHTVPVPDEDFSSFFFFFSFLSNLELSTITCPRIKPNTIHDPSTTIGLYSLGVNILIQKFQQFKKK